MGRRRKVKVSQDNKVEYIESIEFEQLTFEDILREKSIKQRKETKTEEIKTEEKETKTEEKEIIVEEKEIKTEEKEIIVEEKEIISSIPNIVKNNNGKIPKPIVSTNIEVKSDNFLNAYINKETEAKLAKEKMKIMRTFPYKSSKELLTRAEAKLFHFMFEFIQENVLIFPKVRLADIIEIDDEMTYSKNDFYKICYKHVDFLLCDFKTFDIICVVELDDYYHEREDRQKRDQFISYVLNECKIPLVRIKTKIDTITEKDMKDIDYWIKTYYAPKCPLCNSPMEVKSSQRKHNYGHRFWSCKNFPICRGNIDID